MSFQLPVLPYAKNALEPHISEETINYHYGKHHQAYVNNLNNLIPNTEFADLSLEEIIQKASGPIFNNAAQVWNHTFYWHSLTTPNGQDNKPTGELLAAIERSFGSYEEFVTEFSKQATANFGSGWTWLVKNPDGTLKIINTHDANTPIKDGVVTPLLTVDIWEHAYYIDYHNARPDYLKHFWALVNWEFAAKNYVG